MLIPPNKHKNIVTYADDITLVTSGPDINALCDTSNSYLVDLCAWLKKPTLALSAGKSSATLFTTWNNDIYTTLNIFADDKIISTVQNSKLPGVYRSRNGYLIRHGR